MAGHTREFFCPLDGKKLHPILPRAGAGEGEPSKAMGREFAPMKCVNRQGGHIWMVSEDAQTYMVMRQKMGRE